MVRRQRLINQSDSGPLMDRTSDESDDGGVIGEEQRRARSVREITHARIGLADIALEIEWHAPEMRERRHASSIG